MEEHKEQQIVESQGFEQKTEELCSLIFALCEERIQATNGQLTPVHKAFAASALALQHSIATFLAIARICK